MEEAKPSQSSQPTEGGTIGDTTVTTEVQRINRILEIENMDWSRQLKQAVGVNFLISSLDFFGPPWSSRSTCVISHMCPFIL